MASKYENGNQFVLGGTRVWVAKRRRGEGMPLLLFQRPGNDLVAAGEFYSPTVADEFITAMLNGIAELPSEQLEAVVESGRKVTAEQVGLGKGLAL